MHQFLGAILLLFSLNSLAQITSFPYRYDFEGFTTIQNTGSCTTTGMNADNWTQDNTDDGDWLSDTAGTGSIGTGPGSNATISGVNIGMDYNPGTIGGHYLYTESSGCPGDEISMLSPTFDLSASNTYYQFRLAIHMYGSSMGSLHIDVYSGGTWYNDLWVQQGSLDTTWHDISVPMTGYTSSSVQVRIRAITGPSFTSDICIDDARMEEYDPARYDAKIIGVHHSLENYFYVPLGQLDSVYLQTIVKNEGKFPISGTEVTATEGSYTGVAYLDSIYPFETDTAFTTVAYSASTTGNKNINFVVDINEQDSFAFNDSAQLSMTVTDTVYSRDDGVLNVSIGFNGVDGQMGHVFEILTTDTLTSADVYIGTAVGDSVRVLIYDFNGSVGNLLSVTNAVAMTSTAGWVTLRFNCEQVLTPGEYFLAAEQMGLTNAGIGCSVHGYKPNTAFYLASTGTAWTSVETAGFNITFMLRMNFGKTFLPDVSINTAKDTVCEQVQTYFQATGAKTYQWSPSKYFANANLSNVFARFDTSLLVKVVGTNKCGFKNEETIYMNVEKGPTASITSDTTVCEDEQIVLQLNTNNNYRWINGPTNNDYTVQIDSDSLFYAIVDSSNGCSKSLQVQVFVNSLDLELSDDTTLCSGNELTVQATGADTYVWKDGPTTDTYTFIADQAEYKVVTGYTTFGCSETDSVYINSLQTPQLIVTPDTGICFRDSLYMSAYGADSISWLAGPQANIYPLRVIKAGTYIVHAYNYNGCSAKDTVHVAVYSPPSAIIDNDTTVCENSTFTVHASGGDFYEWSTGQTGSSISTSLSSSSFLKVIVSNLAGCTDEDSLYVTVDPLPSADFSSFVDVDSMKVTNVSVNADSYHWDFGDGDTSNEASPYHLYDTSGVYTVTLTAYNYCGSDEQTKSVTIDIPTGSLRAMEAWTHCLVYPSPASSLIHIELQNTLSSEVQINLIDQQARVVKSLNSFKYKETEKYELDVNELAAGLYLLQINMEGNQITRSIVIH